MSRESGRRAESGRNPGESERAHESGRSRAAEELLDWLGVFIGAAVVGAAVALTVRACSG